MSTMDKYATALDRILELVVVINADMAQGLARDGLTVSRAGLLWALRQRGPATQRDLAEALGVTPRTITGLVDGLVATGFVTREPHPTDRRATLVTFTAHGTAVVTAMEGDQRQFADLLFAGMPDDRFEHFVAGLDDVLARLREQGLVHQLTEDQP